MLSRSGTHGVAFLVNGCAWIRWDISYFQGRVVFTLKVMCIGHACLDK